MKYVVALERVETKRVEAFGASHSEVARLAERPGWHAVEVTEVLEGDNPGTTLRVECRCDWCCVPLLSGAYVIWEDTPLCEECARDLEQEGEQPE